MADDIDRWIQVLSGRPPQETSDGVEREAAQLREAVLTREQVDFGQLFPPDPHGLQKLLFRLRSENLLPLTSLWQRKSFAIGIAASVVFATAITVYWSTFNAEDEGTIKTRGLDQPQQLTAYDPLRQAEDMKLQLGQVGVKAIVRSELGEVRLVASLNDAHREEIDAFPVRFGLKRPLPGKLIVIVRRPAQ